MILRIADWLRWLEDGSLAAAIRQSAWLYPILEIIHITGIVLLAGGAFLFDLRLLGFAGRLPIDALGRHLLGWSARGLLLIVPSGLLLFSTNATTLGYDPVFWLKMLLLLLAGGNALLFHRLLAHRPHGRGAKMAAVLSLLLWIGVIACGRLLAY